MLVRTIWCSRVLAMAKPTEKTEIDGIRPRVGRTRGLASEVLEQIEAKNQEREAERRLELKMDHMRFLLHRMIQEAAASHPNDGQFASEIEKTKRQARDLGKKLSLLLQGPPDVAERLRSVSLIHEVAMLFATVALTVPPSDEAKHKIQATIARHANRVRAQRMQPAIAFRKDQMRSRDDLDEVAKSWKAADSLAHELNPLCQERGIPTVGPRQYQNYARDILKERGNSLRARRKFAGGFG